MAWVRAITLCRVLEQGNLATYQPGDWFELKNKGMLRQWIAEGKVERVQHDYAEVFSMSDGGVVIRGKDAESHLKALQNNSDIPAQIGDLALPYPRTLLYETSGTLRLDLLPVGFHRLEVGWQIAAPLWKYEQLARDVGSEEDKRRTRELIHDLRVPLYDPRLLFVRRCPDTERWLKEFKRQLEGADDAKHALLRSLYITKPVVCALPTIWMEGVRYR